MVMRGIFLEGLLLGELVFLEKLLIRLVYLNFYVVRIFYFFVLCILFLCFFLLNYYKNVISEM